MSTAAEKFAQLGVVPVVVLEDAKDAAPLAKALVEGGLPCAEVTFRTDAAEESIKIMASEYPDMFVGAGTVLTIDQVDRAVAAGAKFIVSPGFDPEVVDYCLSKDIPVFPGCITPSEVAQAVKRGLKVVKFFPAEQFGGVATIKAMAAPYVGLKFMPTGGVNAKNLENYLSCDKIVACGGTWMVKKDLIEAENWDEIERLTRQAVQTMLGLRVDHIGINTENEQEAQAAAKLFVDMFGMKEKVGNSSIFVGENEIEIMKKMYLGKNGHIAIATHTLPRAIAYFRARGYEFREETVTDKAAYFKDEIAGFAIHLVQR